MSLILRLWVSQLVIILFGVILLWKSDVTMAYSFGLGGLIHWLPNVFFALSAFRYRASQSAGHLLQSFTRGEVNKFVLTATGFALAFVLVSPLNVLAVFVAFIAMIISQLIIVSRWKIGTEE